MPWYWGSWWKLEVGTELLCSSGVLNCCFCSFEALLVVLCLCALGPFHTKKNYCCILFKAWSFIVLRIIGCTLLFRIYYGIHWVCQDSDPDLTHKNQIGTVAHSCISGRFQFTIGVFNKIHSKTYFRGILLDINLLVYFSAWLHPERIWPTPLTVWGMTCKL